MLNRRDFVKISALTTGGIFLLNPFSIASTLSAEGNTGVTDLLFPEEDIPEIKKRLSSPLFKKFWNELLNADMDADRRFLEEEIQYNNQIRHLVRADKILQREAFIYTITKDKSRGELARLALQTILKFNKWDYFVEAGKHTIGLQRAPFTTQSVILAYDWLKNFLTEDEKAEILKQLPEKGCEPCYRSLYGMLYPDKVVGWGFDPESSYYEERDMRNWPKILSRTNLRAVPMSALGLGAIFLGNRHPRAKEWMDMVKKSYDAFVDMYAPDGSYDEGTGYCRYTSEELIVLLDVLKRKQGLDWSQKINWKGVMDFLLMTVMPSKSHPQGHVNFGDGGRGFGSDIAFWVAHNFNDPKSQYAGIHHYAYHKIFSVIWYDPKIKEKAPEGKWFYRHFDIGWVVVSTGFEPDDFVVAMRSGLPANHEHADRNSVIVKCFSENLLVDNWHPPYNHKHPAWALRTSPAHNTVLIDGKGHQYHNGLEGTNASQAEAKIIHEEVKDNYIVVTSDATQAYELVNDNVEKVLRTLVVLPEFRFLVVLDSLQTKNRPADFKARWFIENEDNQGKIEIYDKTFIFHRPAAKLIGVCESDLSVKLLQDKFPVPAEHGIYPYLDVSAERSGKTVNLIAAMAAYLNEEEAPKIKVDKVETGWYVNSKIDGKTIRVSVVLKDRIPKVSVQID